MKTKYAARKPLSIHENGYVPGDPIPLPDLMRVPDWKKLLRSGHITEILENDDDA